MFALLRRSTSQPLLVLPSQFAKLELHEPIAQLPLLQVGEALAKEQTRPHAPQWVTFVRVFTSQPLLTWPSQFAKPELHLEIPQVLALHTGVPLLVAQTRPHAPQWLPLLVRFTSQPLEATPSQSA